MEKENTPQTKWQRFAAGFNQAAGIAQWILIVVGFFGGYWLYNRDTQTTHAQTLRDLQTGQTNLEKKVEERTMKRDQQLSEMQKQILTRELYEAYHRADEERMNRMEKMLERLLEK